jgi:sulfite exporter TauE/SafE
LGPRWIWVDRSSASPVWGVAVMAAFWLGTLPMMATLGFGVQAISGPLRARLPLITSLVLVAAGVWTLLGRMAMPAIAARAPGTPVGMEESVQRASHVENDCPLCNHKPGKEN